MQHLHHFGLTQDPFSNEPDLRFYFESAAHADALRRVDRGLRQHKGLTVLTGDAGTGKSLLARRLFESLEEEVFEATLMVILPGAADAQTVLQRYARQLGVEEPAADRSILLAQIYEQLAIVREDGRHAILVVDDAHIMSAEDVAEIGGLLGMEYEDRRLISLLLVGMPELDERMTGESALMQRVDVRVRLQPLDLTNTTAYIAHRLTVVGGQLNLFPAESIEALFKLSRGRPRLINTLGDNALFETFLAGRRAAEAGDVERAASDLGIGPDPGTTYSGLAPVAPPPAPAPAAAPSVAQPPAPSPPPPDAPVFEEKTVFDPGTSMSKSGGVVADLGALLDAPGGDSSANLAAELAEDPVMGSGTLDLDTEVEAVLSEQPQSTVAPQHTMPPAPAAPTPGPAPEPLPQFSGQNANPNPSAEVTRVALGDDPSTTAGGSGEVQDLDDLFVELIEE